MIAAPGTADNSTRQRDPVVRIAAGLGDVRRRVMSGLSIIIPAHNEATVVARTLASIVANRFDQPLQIIVVANGCTDETAQVVRQFSDNVELVETPVGSKTHALNLGDRVAKYDLRAYLDAD